MDTLHDSKRRLAISKLKIVLSSALSLSLITLLSGCGGNRIESEAPPQTIPGLNAQGFARDANGFFPNEYGIYPDANGKFLDFNSAGLFFNPSGVARSYSTAGPINTDHPFFKNFGNGRTCATCHVQAEAFTVTPTGLQMRFEQSNGTDPIFRTVDGSNSPLAPVATLEQRRSAYSMLLKRGVIRIGMPVPANAEFELVGVDDPYHFASARELSLFRRILPAANLKFLGSVMWDNRESAIDPSSNECIRAISICFALLDANLLRQANGATRGHAQAARDLTPDELRQIVDFEKTLVVAQELDYSALALSSANAKGGTATLLKTDYYFDINDLFADPRTGLPGRKEAIQLYGNWANQSTNTRVGAARQSIARGEVLFNTKAFDIVNTLGVNDVFGPLVKGTCSFCHNVPQVGGFSLPVAFDIGVADAANRTPDMPLYTLRNKSTGALQTTQDPGQAMQTGRWSDIGRFKSPGLRGLAARPPYFHDGSAQTIEQVMVFYETRFKIGLSAQETADMVAFMKSL